MSIEHLIVLHFLRFTITKHFPDSLLWFYETKCYHPKNDLHFKFRHFLKKIFLDDVCLSNDNLRISQIVGGVIRSNKTERIFYYLYKVPGKKIGLQFIYVATFCLLSRVGWWKFMIRALPCLSPSLVIIVIPSEFQLCKHKKTFTVIACVLLQKYNITWHIKD